MQILISGLDIIYQFPLHIYVWYHYKQSKLCFICFLLLLLVVVWIVVLLMVIVMVVVVMVMVMVLNYFICFLWMLLVVDIIFVFIFIHSFFSVFSLQNLYINVPEINDKFIGVLLYPLHHHLRYQLLIQNLYQQFAYLIILILIFNFVVVELLHHNIHIFYFLMNHLNLL